MKTTERFENAVTKLYNAFNEGTLDAMDCTHCAVGNLCDNSEDWINFMSDFGSVNRIDNSFINKTGYSNKELSLIETIFIYGVTNPQEGDYKFRNNISESDIEAGVKTITEQRELQFKGLCAVVEYLCELDNIPNVMDYTALFSNEKQLQEVF